MLMRSHSTTARRAPQRRQRAPAATCAGRGAPAKATLESLLTDWLTRVALATAPPREEPASEVAFCGRVEHVLQTEEEARARAARQLERVYARLRLFADPSRELPGRGSDSTTQPGQARDGVGFTSAGRASPSRT